MKSIKSVGIVCVTLFVLFFFCPLSFAAEWQDGIEDDIYIDTGKVGIGVDPGTLSGDYKLAVKGNIVAEEIIVDVSVFPDFVFEDGYKLPSLDEVENHIKENKHLPDAPSAREVQENGMNMSEMMTLQMKKIEELTLYMIELNKKYSEVVLENQELKTRVETLEKGY